MTSWKKTARDALDAALAGDTDTAQALGATAEIDKLLSEMPGGDNPPAEPR